MWFRRSRLADQERMFAHYERLLARGYWRNMARVALPMFVSGGVILHAAYFLGMGGGAYLLDVVLQWVILGTMGTFLLPHLDMQGARNMLRQLRSQPLATPEVPAEVETLGESVRTPSEPRSRWTLQPLRDRVSAAIPRSWRLASKQLRHGLLARITYRLTAVMVIVIVSAGLVGGLTWSVFHTDGSTNVEARLAGDLAWILGLVMCTVAVTLGALKLFAVLIQPTYNPPQSSNTSPSAAPLEAQDRYTSTPAETPATTLHTSFRGRRNPR